MIPDQLLRSFVARYRAALTIILFLTSTLLSLCLVLIENHQKFSVNVQPLTLNTSLLVSLTDDNNDTYFNGSRI